MTSASTHNNDMDDCAITLQRVIEGANGKDVMPTIYMKSGRTIEGNIESVDSNQSILRIVKSKNRNGNSVVHEVLISEVEGISYLDDTTSD